MEAATARPGEGAAPRRRLRRDVGRVALLFTSVGSVIGSGWLLGALNAITHVLVTEINTTYITATSVCALLRTIAALGGAVPVTLVLDNARYQRCALVQDAA